MPGIGLCPRRRFSPSFAPATMRSSAGFRESSSRRVSPSGNKNMGAVYDKDRPERATQTEFLEKRIEINRAYSSVDFDRWLLRRLQVAPGEDILDVGCGSGAQTIPFSQVVGADGSVSAVDISADS